MAISQEQTAGWETDDGDKDEPPFIEFYIRRDNDNAVLRGAA